MAKGRDMAKLPTYQYILHSVISFLFSQLGKLAGSAIYFADVFSLFFSPLGKIAERAIYFTLRNFFFFFFIIFFNDFSETNYLKIGLTDFRNLYIE